MPRIKRTDKEAAAPSPEAMERWLQKQDAAVEKTACRMKKTTPAAARGPIPIRPDTALDEFVRLRRDYLDLQENLGKLKDHLIERVLAGQLDTTGHIVEVHRIDYGGGGFGRVLTIDGHHGWIKG